MTITAQRARVLGMTVAAALCLPSAAWADCASPVARIVAIDNLVELKDAGGAAYARVVLNAPVCEGDQIRVGEFSRATVAFLATGLRLTIEQNTEFAVRPPRRAGRSFIDLLRGAVLFFTRQPRSLDVRTPFLNAAVEGTEFIIRVEGNRTEVAVIEGAVATENEQGSLTLTGGQSGQALAGQAPQRIDVRPQDAVRWALYYDPILPLASIADLEQVPSGSRDARYFVQRAGALLRAGRVDEARAELSRAGALEPSNSDALALAAVIDVAQNNKDAALEKARRAVSLAPQSVSARLAHSYALQANFELEGARDELLAILPGDPGGDRPEHAPALSRLAELWLSLGYTGRAVDAANRAVAVAPDQARAHIVLGFAELARTRTPAATASFERAIALGSNDPLARLGPNDPLAHLGLGLAKIRGGDLEGGRADIETAAALDVEDAVIRSYLGKAYFEEKRDGLSAEQLALAKQFDPLDPTPYFYDAIRKQTVNRPVQALHDLQTSIGLNNNRAVYRSRLLLDGDRAARGVRTGRVYRDLGFEQLALQAGWASLNVEPLNHSAHRLLADGYLTLPRHEIARDSELLQSQLLQPVNVNPVQPRLADTRLTFLDDSGISAVGLNEYTRLFEGNQVRVQADGLVGNRDTVTSNAIVSGVFDRLSFSVGNFHHTSDGVRENHDIRRNIFNAFIQAELTPSTSVLAEFRATDGRDGDRPLLFAADNFSPVLRSEFDRNSLRLGFRQRFTPAAALIGTYSRQTGDQAIDDSLGFDVSFSLTDEAVTNFTEVRYLHGWRNVHVTGGLGRFQADLTSTFALFGEETSSESETRHTNGYVYTTVNLADAVSIVAGLSADSFESPSLSLDRSQANPKLGLTWSITPRTTVRGAAFRTLKRLFVSSQTIEPTNVAGFNQFFDDGNGTDSWRYGVAIDQRTWRGGYAGAEFSRRDNSTPLFIGPNTSVQFNDWEDNIGRAYVYSTVGEHTAISIELVRERIHDPRGNNPDFVVKSLTYKVPLEARFFHPIGLNGRVRATYVRQRGTFLDRQLTEFAGEDDFWVADASIGFALPRRLGSAALDIRNLFDETFRFQDSDPRDPTIIPGRQVLARLTVAF